MARQNRVLMRSAPKVQEVVNELQVRGQRLVYRTGLVGSEREKTMLWTIFVVCLLLWLLGFSLSIGGSLIHLLLVVAVVVLIFNLVSGRRVV